MRTLFKLILIAISLFTIIQCSSTEYMPAVSSLSVEDSNYQFSDSTVAKAFEQFPQISLPLKVAIYDSGFESLAIADSLERFDEIQSVTYISSSMIEGGSYYSRLAKPWYATFHQPPKTNLIQLRTLAAQSHSDVILFLGTNHIVYGDTNLWALTYFGLVPMLFMKGNKVEVHSFIDMQLIDVRNGFIYAAYRNQAKSKDGFVKINNEKDKERLKERNIQSLTAGLLAETKRILSREDFRLSRK